jgi:hypothetical protein
VRALDPLALPDIEVFWHDGGELIEGEEPAGRGWYWWACLPGCLPDSDPHGPFATEAEALASAQDGYDDYDDG